MASEIRATLTSKGQITLPSRIREQWQLKPGDQIGFTILDEAEGRIVPWRKRSIFERLEELRLPSLGRPLSQTDIDASVEEAVGKKHGRTKR